MKVLVTGFEPFGGEAVNPAWEAVKLLPGEIEGAAILRQEVPVSFRQSVEQVTGIIQRERPDLVLCVGQAGGRASLTVERVAINLMDAPIPDNDGDMPRDVPVVQDGPDGLFATIPVKAAVAAARQAGVAADLSCSAGTYVCNCLMYGVLHALREHPGARGGFVHVPFIPSQTADKPGRPSMALEDIAKGLAAMLSALIGGETSAAGEGTIF